MSTEAEVKPHDREGRSLIEASAAVRAIHAQESTVLVRHLQAQLARVVEEYAKRSFPAETHADRRIEGEIQLAVVNLRARMETK